LTRDCHEFFLGSCTHDGSMPICNLYTTDTQRGSTHDGGMPACTLSRLTVHAASGGSHTAGGRAQQLLTARGRGGHAAVCARVCVCACVLIHTCSSCARESLFCVLTLAS